MRLMVLILAMYAGCSFAEGRVWGILMGGQSNMEGHARGADLPDSVKSMPPNVQLYVIRGRGAPPKPRATLVGLNPNAKFGPEVAFIRNVAARFPEEAFVIVKFAAGGTGMDRWTPGGGLHNRLTAGAQAVQRSYVDSGVDFQWKGFLWAQGGADARFKRLAPLYRVRTEALVSSVRDLLNTPDMPFIFKRTTAPGDQYKGLNIVRMAQEAIDAEVANTELIRNDTYPTLPDNVHFNAHGQMLFGADFATLLMPYLDGSTNSRPNREPESGTTLSNAQIHKLTPPEKYDQAELE